MGWGYQPERLQAGVYFLFYTLTVSLPLLFIIFMYYSNYATLDFYLGQSLTSNRIILVIGITLAVTMAFMVKLPIFITHL
jgi:NADH-ubiquinone oxidoreductase chain 4